VFRLNRPYNLLPLIVSLSFAALQPSVGEAACNPGERSALTTHNLGSFAEAATLPYNSEVCFPESSTEGEVRVRSATNPDLQFTASRSRLVPFTNDQEREKISAEIEQSYSGASSGPAGTGTGEKADCLRTNHPGGPPGPGTQVPATQPSASPATGADTAPSAGGGSSGLPSFENSPVFTNPAQEPRSTGAIFGNGAPTRVMPANNIGAIQEAANLAQNAHGNELSGTATAQRSAASADIRHDYQTLQDTYRRIPKQELGNRFQRAQQELDRMAGDFQAFTQGGQGQEISLADQTQYRNAILNARDKARIAKELLNLGEAQGGGAGSADGSNPLAQTKDLEELFSNGSGATASDSLADRLLMLAGLPEDLRAKVFSKLRLKDRHTLKLPDGRSKKLAVLRNDSGREQKQALDCAKFVASALSAESRKWQFTTLDLKSIWYKARTGRLPVPPKWGKGRAELIEKFADGFVPVDLYLGERPKAGDLLVYRVPAHPEGRVFIVREYNPETMVAKVLEANSQGALQTREVPLSFDPPQLAVRLVRPGFVDLRLKATDNAACKYRGGASP